MAVTPQDDGPRFPPGFDAFLLEGFEGLNTKAKRPAIKDQEFGWSENIIPIGAANARMMWGADAPIYTASGGLTIINTCFYNIGSTAYGIAFLDDGSADQFTLSTGAVVQVGAAGTFWANGNVDTPTIAQWSDKGILIVSRVSANAYWAWDGVLYSPGDPAPSWLSGLDAPLSFTGDTNTSTSVTNVTPDPTVSGAVAGMTITDTAGDIPANTTITEFTTNTFTLSQAATGSTASDTLTLDWTMPFGISGTAIEIFLSRVWIVGGTFRLTSVASNGTDFSVANGGVGAQSTDSSLRVRYTGIKQANGYLYVFGDSQSAYITNVQTTATPTTTYQYTVIDPQIGTPWRDTIIPYGRSILFANTNGIFALYGSSANKISDPLDGIWNDDAADFAAVVPSCAVQTIFGIKVFLITVSTIDPTTQQRRTLMAMFDGKKWFMGSQVPAPILVAPQEIDSHLEAFGCDGRAIYDIFSVASESLPKLIVSKLWGGKYGYLSRKQALRFYSEVQALNNTSVDIAITLDTEALAIPLVTQFITFINNSGGGLQFQNNGFGNLSWTVQPTAQIQLDFGQTLTFVNNVGGILQFQNNSGDDLIFQTAASVSVNNLDGSGLLLGFTLATTSPDFILMSAGIGYIPKSPLGF